MERIICSEEEARQFYLSDRAMCPAGDKDCYSEKTRSSYSEHSSEELERKWANEEFIRLLPKINPENTQNLPYLKKAPEWYKSNQSADLFAEKPELIACNGEAEQIQ